MELKDLQLEYENKIYDIEHFLEDMHYKGKGLNPVRHFVLLKKIQKYRIERRKVKLELRVLRDFVNNKKNVLEYTSRQGMYGQIEWVLDNEFELVLRGYEDVGEIL